MHRRIHRIAGSARDVGHDGALFARDAVNQRGFARVGAADHRHTDHIGILFLLRFVRQILEHRIQQIAGAVSVHRGYRDRVAQPQIIELIKVGGQTADVVALVDRQHHRLAAFLQHHRDIRIVGGDTGQQIGHQHDHIRLFDRELRLPPHLGQDHIVRIRLDTAGIRQHKRTSAPFTRRKQPVTGHARRIFYDRQPLPDQFIKQGGLSNIGSPHNRHHRPCHTAHLLISIILNKYLFYTELTASSRPTATHHRWRPPSAARPAPAPPARGSHRPKS